MSLKPGPMKGGGGGGVVWESPRNYSVFMVLLMYSFVYDPSNT